MSTEASTSASEQATTGPVFVQIPKAGPGQGYKAPKNFQQPGLDLLWRVLVVLLCLSLPVAVGGIIVMIFILDHASAINLIWLWVSLGLFVEIIAIFCAINIGREALGNAGSGQYTR